MGRSVEFKCFKCGCCCRGVDAVPALRKLADRHGDCRYYDPDTHMCQIYDRRPKLCNVEASYESVSDEIEWDDFVFTNMLNCVLLRHLQGVPEPEGSPFVGMQEEIANRLENDTAAARGA